MAPWGDAGTKIDLPLAGRVPSPTAVRIGVYVGYLICLWETSGMTGTHDL